ncbi:MAG: haloacid dehalogenase-like hydrolase [Verrucomicrobiota bacterium]|nr:haloacid dehalogenase-like hydrolase [Verrucomicrobiota bacterium]
MNAPDYAAPGTKRLLLWDIDATLITTGGAGYTALKQVVQDRFGVRDEFHDIEIAGRTDRGIAANILRKYGLEPSERNIAEFLGEYLRGLEELLPQTSGRVLPGIAEILARLHDRSDYVLALLTGNLRRGAELKLRHYGLWDYFEFGAFADDHHDRNELGAFARKRAREKHGAEFAVAQIDVIGDTGHDIACGRIFGARTIAVATGSWTRAQLAAEAPDFLFDNFARVDEVMRTLGWAAD